MTVRRMWINAPSKNQKHHTLHGTRVLATEDGFKPRRPVSRVYFLDGDVVSMEIGWMALSEGWPKENKDDKS